MRTIMLDLQHRELGGAMKQFLALAVLLLALAGVSQAQNTQHGVALTWTASISTVAGYNVYRSTTSGGLYVKINPTLVANLFYLDSDNGLTVSTTYYYVATAVDASGNESAFSTQVSITTPATFPANPAPPTGLTAKQQ